MRIVNLDALTYAGNLDTLASVDDRVEYSFVHGDIGDAECVTRVLAEHQPTAIVNFAAESHVDRSIDGPAAFVQTNVVGTLTLLEGALAYWHALPLDRQDAFRFLHVSSDEVYGSLGPGASARNRRMRRTRHIRHRRRHTITSCARFITRMICQR